MLRLNALLAMCALALTTVAANANSIVTFDVSGTFNNPLVTMYHPPADLSGTLTVDVTAGAVIGTNLVVPGFSNFSTILHSYEFFAGTWTMTTSNSSGSILDFTFTPSPVPVSGQLVGLNFGAIGGGEVYVACALDVIPGCRTWDNWGGLFQEYFGGNSLRGNLTAELGVTPLPAALPLFATGLGLTWLLSRRRNRISKSAITA